MGEPGAGAATAKSVPTTVADPDDRTIGDQLPPAEKKELGEPFVRRHYCPGLGRAFLVLR